MNILGIQVDIPPLPMPGAPPRLPDFELRLLEQWDVEERKHDEWASAMRACVCPCCGSRCR